MPELVGDCPRCDANQITFDVEAATILEQRYGWQYIYEAFAICRACHRSSVFVLSERTGMDFEKLHSIGLMNVHGTLNRYVETVRFISVRDRSTVQAPEFIPDNIKKVFEEGASSLAGGCFNAAGTMFRLCVDLATRAMLPKEEASGLNAKTRRDLGLRIPWLFEHGLLPESLKELSSCIKDDGNDGAHAGTLSKEDAEDLLDFTSTLLERLYTEPQKLRLAKERRESRRTKA